MIEQNPNRATGAIFFKFIPQVGQFPGSYVPTFRKIKENLPKLFKFVLLVPETDLISTQLHNVSYKIYKDFDTKE